MRSELLDLWGLYVYLKVIKTNASSKQVAVSLLTSKLHWASFCCVWWGFKTKRCEFGNTHNAFATLIFCVLPALRGVNWVVFLVAFPILSLLAPIQDYGPTNTRSYEDYCTKALSCLCLEVKGEPALRSRRKQLTKQCLDTSSMRWLVSGLQMQPRSDGTVFISELP